MKKILLCLVACFAAISAFAEAITSSPSPAVTTKALEITITCDDMGSTVYCYTWCADVNGSEFSPFEWNSVNTSKFQMTGSGGTYKLKINDIQSFYGLTDSQMEGLTKLGFIAKTTSGAQTGDLFVSVVQGRKNAYSGGDGSQTNPFVLKTVKDLEEFATTSMDWASDCYIVMGADIDLKGSGFNGIASKSSPFKGHFDGAGYSIKNASVGLPMNPDNSLAGGISRAGNSAGIFNAIDGAEIKNLGVVNVEVKEETWAGGLVGYAASGVISRCFVTGKVAGAIICTGGFVGENKGATITDCYSACEVVGGDAASGGFAGKNCGSIKNVYATGKVSGDEYIGGLVGANYGVVSNSVALNASVDSNENFVARFGGNNNSENRSTGNLGWTDMSHSSTKWTEYGDHATASTGTALTTQSTYQSTLGWNFSDVWEWRTENGNSYAALRGLNNQANSNPDALYDTTGIEEIIAGEATAFRVYPNPTVDMLNVSVGEAIASCELYGLNGAVAMAADVDGTNALTMNLGSLANGVYMLKVVTVEGDVIINKIIKK